MLYPDRCTIGNYVDHYIRSLVPLLPLCCRVAAIPLSPTPRRSFPVSVSIERCCCGRPTTLRSSRSSATMVLPPEVGAE